MTKGRNLIIRLGVRFAKQRDNGSFNSKEEYRLIELLSYRVDEMLTDLGLSNCKLTIRVASQNEPTSRFLFNAELDGSICFGPLDKEKNALPGVDQLAEIIATTIFQRRDTLFTDLVNDIIWEWVANDLPPGWKKAEFHKVVGAAIRHGLNVPETIIKFMAYIKGGLRHEELSDQIEALLAVHAESKILVKVNDIYGFDEKVVNEEVRDSLFFKTGIVFPLLEFEKDESLGPNEFRLVVNKLRTSVKRVEAEMSAEFLVQLLQSHGSVLTTATSVDSALGRLAKAFPMVIFNTVEAYGTTSTLRLLRSLVDEGVDIRDLRTILGTRLETNGTLPVEYEQLAVFLPYEATFIHEVQSAKGKPDSDSYVGCVRVQLRDQISQAFADSNRVLHVVRLAAKWEARLSKLNTKPLSEDETFEILSATTRAVEAAGPIGTVLLASSRNRRRFREVIRHEFPEGPVLCEAEISPYVRHENAGEIGAVTSLSLKSGT